MEPQADRVLIEADRPLDVVTASRIGPSCRSGKGQLAAGHHRHDSCLRNELALVSTRGWCHNLATQARESRWSPPAPARVLVVAHKTAATQALLDAVPSAPQGPAASRCSSRTRPTACTRSSTPRTRTARGRAIAGARCRCSSDAAGGPVDGIIGDPNPLDAIQDAVNLRGFDEIIISTLPARVSNWLKLDLPASSRPRPAGDDRDRQGGGQGLSPWAAVTRW